MMFPLTFDFDIYRQFFETDFLLCSGSNQQTKLDRRNNWCSSIFLLLLTKGDHKVLFKCYYTVLEHVIKHVPLYSFTNNHINHIYRSDSIQTVNV